MFPFVTECILPPSRVALDGDFQGGRMNRLKDDFYPSCRRVVEEMFNFWSTFAPST